MGETLRSFMVQNLHAPQTLRQCQQAQRPPCSFQSSPQRPALSWQGGRKGAAKFPQQAAGKTRDSEQLAKSPVYLPALIAVGFSKARGAPAAFCQENVQRSII